MGGWWPEHSAPDTGDTLETLSAGMHAVMHIPPDVPQWLLCCFSFESDLTSCPCGTPVGLALASRLLPDQSSILH